MRKLGVFLLALIFYLSYAKADVLSDIYPQILKDFSPLSGFLVDHEDKGWVIDKGSAEGVKKGGLWGIYKTYPATELVGVLEITQTEKHFSFAKLLMQKEKIKLPSPIKRLENLKIALVFKGKQNKEFIDFLKSHFPNWELDFLSTFPVKAKYDFIFLITKYGIKIYDRNLKFVRSYGGFDWVSVTEVPKRLEIANCKLLGKIPSAILQADFKDINNDGLPEMVYLTSKGLFVVKIKGDLVAYYIPVNGKPESFSIGPNGWLALNLLGKQSMKSEILKVSGNMILPVIQKLNYELKFINDVLFGQSPKGVFILQRAGDKVFPVKEVKIPSHFKLLPSTFADLNGDGKNELITISPKNKVVIYKDNQVVWESPFKINQTNLFNPQFLVMRKNKKAIVFIGKTSFPLDIIIKDLPYIPLNYATSQVIALAFKNGFFWKEITPPKQGFIIGLGLYKEKLFYVILKGSYPNKPLSELYYCEF